MTHSELIEDDDDEEYELAGVDLNEARRSVLEQIAVLDDELTSIKDQLSRATASQMVDNDWRRRAERAMGHKQRQRKALQIELDEINDRIRIASSRDRMFVDAAREALDPSTFDAIWKMVNDREQHR